jgi:CRISPR system Cascade subunit CasC
MKTLIEIHVLQNYAPSNLNRDDTGAPKDAFFGGVRRARVSSQCLKRSIRQYFLDLVKRDILLSTDIAIRTKRVLDALVKALVEKGRQQSEATEKVRAVLASMKLPVKHDGKSEYLLFLGQREISAVADIIHEKWDSIMAGKAPDPDAKKSGKAKKQAAQSADPELKKALERVFDGGKAVDVALFGRMLADMPEKNQYAACQVAHAISTHAVEQEFDFYTAVDDLKPEDTAGADMMGTLEFNSACLYRYAVIDWGKLLENLQNDSDLAIRGAKAFLEGFVIAEPTGKQNTFAAHNPPEFIAVSVRRNTVPRSLANAFEIPLRASKEESLTKESAVRIANKAIALDKLYGTADNSRYAVTEDVFEGKLMPEGFGKKLDSLKRLIEWVESELSKQEV